MIQALAPYLACTAAVAAYNFFFLRYGFNATDEGWLLSLGKRIAEGEQPYLDFYFLKTPLSIYIQAALIELLGTDYTILVSRIYWTIQMWGLAVAVSLLYRRQVRPLELAALLLTTYVISSMLVAFPWYNYDAAFLAALAVLLLSRRRFITAGFFAFLAFMAKQNFLLLLPLFFGAIMLSKWLKIGIEVTAGRAIIRTGAGFGVALSGYLAYLLAIGALDDFFINVFILPPRCSGISTWFALFQNNHVAFVISLPLVLMLLAWFFAKNRSWLIAAMLLAPLVFYIVLIREAYFVYTLVFLNYAVLILVVLRLYRGREKPVPGTAMDLLPILIALAVVQYLSGFTYAGILYSYVGAGVMFPLTYVLLREAGPLPLRRFVPAGILLVILALGSYYKFTYMYRDDVRRNLTAEFESGRLRGIKSTPRNVRQISAMLQATDQYSKPGDFILAYPDFPVLYFLTDRKNATRIGWYYQTGFTAEMMREAVEHLEENRPRIVYIQTFEEGDYRRAGERLSFGEAGRYYPLDRHVTENYLPADTIGDIFLFVPEE
ncbi:MAG: hypothetical protein JSV44_07535 [Candidatus Zixiibacteriota bacterium]|nr:MAG: hypothetical protein JSV44_07535 [candidate division Zixibacteria bacterium]